MSLEDIEIIPKIISRIIPRSLHRKTIKKKFYIKNAKTVNESELSHTKREIQKKLLLKSDEPTILAKFCIFKSLVQKFGICGVFFKIYLCSLFLVYSEIIQFIQFFPFFIHKFSSIFIEFGGFCSAFCWASSFKEAILFFCC